MNEQIKKEMVAEAFRMLEYSYAPYSHFKVGAALLSANGMLYGGCNVENAAYGPSNCAERTAFFKAVSEGVKDFKAIAVCGGPQKIVKDFCSPCGVCRQVMREFCKDDFILIMAKSKTEYKLMTLAEILPQSFKPDGEVGAEQKN